MVVPVGQAAETQLEQEFDAGALLLGGNSEPVEDRRLSLFRDRVDPAFFPAFLPDGVSIRRLDQLGAQEPLQLGVDLPVALTPEVMEAPLSELLDAVAGDGTVAQEPEDHVPCFAFFVHFYI
jgi:hypothetical protein